jgi:hypothetical protein
MQGGANSQDEGRARAVVGGTQVFVFVCAGCVCVRCQGGGGQGSAFWDPTWNPVCSASNIVSGSRSSTIERSLLKRLSTRPVGFVWKKDSGARSTRSAILSCTFVAATTVW